MVQPGQVSSPTVKQIPAEAPDQVTFAEALDLPDFDAMARASVEQARILRAATTTPKNVAAALRRLLEASAPIEEDGGSEADREAFSEAFQDACFVVACMEDEG